MESALQQAPILRLKASLYPFTLLELNELDLPAIERDLRHRLKQAPQLLHRAPVVIQLPQQPVTHELGAALLTLLSRLTLIPIGIRSKGEQHQALANALQLPLLNESTADKTSKKQRKSLDSATESKTKTPLIIQSPVRSGQQIIHAEGDVIVFGHVGQGAEVLASGSIHIYGTLNGRALAGIHGDESSTICCQKLQAELCAIAGHYQVSDDMDHQHWQKPAYIQLSDGRLIIQSV